MIKFSGGSNLQSSITYFHNLQGNCHAGVRKSLVDIGRTLKDKSRGGIAQSAKNYKPYTYNWKGGRFRTISSSPNSYPAEQTGRLGQSIGFQFGAGDSIIFGSRIKYARYLELGTKKMQARPFLMRTINDNDQEIRQIIENNLKARGI